MKYVLFDLIRDIEIYDVVINESIINTKGNDPLSCKHGTQIKA